MPSRSKHESSFVQPTHPRIAVCTEYDALVIFEAVRLGLLPLHTSRLPEDGKGASLRAGMAFVWEEWKDQYNPKLSLLRWTDGLNWSQSRMRDAFLLYEEVPPFDRTAPHRAKKARHPSRRERRTKPNGLRKLTLSVMVALNSADPAAYCKWHLVCYMSKEDPVLPHVSQDEVLQHIHVPDGIYFYKQNEPMSTDIPDRSPWRFSFTPRCERREHLPCNPSHLTVAPPSPPSSYSGLSPENQSFNSLPPISGILNIRPLDSPPFSPLNVNGPQALHHPSSLWQPQTPPSIPWRHLPKPVRSRPHYLSPEDDVQVARFRRGVAFGLFGQKIFRYRSPERPLFC